jgi:hypothetical protein
MRKEFLTLKERTTWLRFEITINDLIVLFCLSPAFFLRNRLNFLVFSMNTTGFQEKL